MGTKPCLEAAEPAAAAKIFQCVNHRENANLPLERLQPSGDGRRRQSAVPELAGQIHQNLNARCGRDAVHDVNGQILRYGGGGEASAAL